MKKKAIDLETLARLYPPSERPRESARELSAAMALVGLVRENGSFVMLKADPERTSRVFTVLISDGPLGPTALRHDADSLTEGLRVVLSTYAKRVWGTTSPGEQSD